MEKYFDLSHEISEGLKTYKGLPAPIICDYISREQSKSSYEDGSEFQIAKLEMVANTGTYLDCPFHRFQDGLDFTEIELKDLCDIEACIIRHELSNGICVDKDLFTGIDLKNKAVLIQTGWSKYWNTDSYYEDHPFLSEEAAIFLRDKGVKLVGIDSHNIDDTRTTKRPVHRILLESNILIVEHLCNLENVPDADILFTALPPKIKGVGSFPVRAVVKILNI